MMMLSRAITRRASQRRDHRERGAAAVEFALTLLPLLMIIFGVLHFGFALAQKASLNSAVRSGARYGSVNIYNSVADPHSCDKTVARAQEGVATLGMTASAVTFRVYKGATLAAAQAAGAICTNSSPNSTPPCDDSDQADSLYVVASYTTNLVGIPFTGINRTVLLQSVGAFRCEYS